MNYLFTSESVSEGHPDKIADQISDAILDNYLAFDPHSKVACETFVTSGQVIIGGEVHSRAKSDHHKIIRNLIKVMRNYFFAAYGHVGRNYQQGVTKTFTDISGNKDQRKVDLFTWEKTDVANDLSKLFKIK